MDTDLVRAVARGLRYRPLDHLVGRVVEVRDVVTVEDAIRLAVGPDLPEGCRLVGPEVQFREAAVAKYGILDLRFAATAEALAGDARTGVPVLRELGFLAGGAVGPSHRVCDDPTCLEMLQDEVTAGQAWLLLFLEGGRPEGSDTTGGSDGRLALRIPDGYLPRPFCVADACVTNASTVWLWKHFYW